MKRHSSLTPLSRQHHGALILSRLLQNNAPVYKGLPSDAEGKVLYASKFYHDELVKHFLQEENMLQHIRGIDTRLDQMIDEIFVEHQQLHSLFSSMEKKTDLQNHLHETGVYLEEHIRKEERVLFPLMQELCNEEQFAAIEKSLSEN